jgi:glycosyltransferase involved in cell wall biosynthesis
VKPVIFLSATGVMGGAEVYLARLTQALNAAGQPCEVVAPSRTPLFTRLRELDIKTTSWPAWLEPLVVRRPGGLGRVSRAVSRAAGLLAAPASRSWARKLQKDRGAILHLNTTRVAFLAGDRTATVAELKDALGPPFFSVRFSRAIAKRLAAAAQVVVANSRFNANRLVESGFPADRVVTILNGLDLDLLHPLSASERQMVRSREGWASNEVVLCCVGRLVEWKGQHLAVEAAARLGERGARVRLVLIGDLGFDGPDYSARLRSQASTLGLDGQVVFTGFRDDAQQLMAASDVVLHTSIWPEPLGLTPMEAQALGVPVVASGAGGVLETVADRETGYLFKPGDVEDLCHGIEWALGTDRDSLRLAGRRRAQELFDMRNVVTRYKAVYQSL